MSNINDDYRLGQWHVVYNPSRPQPVVCDADDRPVATVHEADDQATLFRALLIAKAPSLRDAAILALQSFRVIAANDWGRASEAAEQLLPYFETVLYGIGAEDADPALGERNP